MSEALAKQTPSPEAVPEAVVYGPEIPPAYRYPYHHQTAAFVKEHEIVTVDANDRGHRPTWTTQDGTKSAGEFLSYYEMEQIAGNRDQIVNNPPSKNEVPDPPEPSPDPPIPGPEPPVRAPGPTEPAPGPTEPAPGPGGGGRRGGGPRFPRWPRRRGGGGEGGGRRRSHDDESDPSKVKLFADDVSATERMRRRADMPAHERIKLRRLEAREAKEKKEARDEAEGRDFKTSKKIMSDLRHKKMHPSDFDKIEVLEEVPWLYSRMLRSKFFERLAPRRYREESFTLLEYHNGLRPPSRRLEADGGTRVDGYGRRRGTVGGIRDVGDRRAKRFIVKEEVKGVIAPHVIRDEDRGRKWLPDARKTSRGERRRREALIMSRRGETWAGGLHSQGREAIGVGPDRGLTVIGFDARRVDPGNRWTYYGRGILDSFGINRKPTSHEIRRASDELSAGQLGDLNAKLRARGEHAQHIRQGRPGRAPTAPPHPHDRRTARWQNWGALQYRFMFRRMQRENDRRRTVRPHTYRT